MNVGIFIFDDVEVLDFAGPYEVFTTASRVQQRDDPGAVKPFDVFTVAAQRGDVRARAGLVVRPEFSFADHPSIDLLIIPGGVVEAEMRSLDSVDWVQRNAANAVITASVCTGAFILAAAGLLHGKAATTHWEDVAALQDRFPDVEVVEGRYWVEQDKLVTSGGISAGIHMSLRLVERCVSKALARSTARQMEFEWSGLNGPSAERNDAR